MMKFQTKRNKSSQYVIGGTVAVIILALWISLPLMSGSSLDSSVSTGNPFKSRVADISLLGSDISSEAGAPGSPLNGSMINNPATSGEDMASSLFQSGPGEDTPAVPEAAASADAAAAPDGAPSASGGVPSPGGSRGKLAAAASLSGSNSGSMTTGGLHNKFFGAGSQKSDFTPALSADQGKMAARDAKNSSLAMLSNSADKSKLAAKTGNMDAARGGGASAFANTAKASGSDMGDDLEGKAAQSGLQLGQTAQDLKKNDPSLNKTKITPPSPPKDATNESEKMKQELKMMVIKMVLQMALGAVFGMAA